MPEQKRSSKKVLLIFLAVLVVSLGGTLIYFQSNALQNLRDEVESEKIALEATRDRLETLIKHRERAPEYERRLTYAEIMIPAEAGEEGVLRYISRLAEEYDLRAVEIRFDARTEGEGYTAMPFALNLEGDFQGLRRLLGHLHGGERAVRVGDIRLSRAGGESGALRISISARAFYAPSN